METLISLKRIIDTLPPYVKKQLETDGPEKVFVSLDDVIKSLSDYEKNTFLGNFEKTLPQALVTLDEFDDDVIISYLEDKDYKVIGW